MIVVESNNHSFSITALILADDSIQCDNSKLRCWLYKNTLLKISFLTIFMSGVNITSDVNPKCDGMETYYCPMHSKNVLVFDVGLVLAVYIDDWKWDYRVSS